MTDLSNTPTNTSLVTDTRAFPRALQAEFLKTLAHWGNVRAAAKAVGVARATVYRMRQACPTFQTLWDAALLAARPLVEEVLADRALNGVEESVFYHGEEVATRVRYDTRLLLAHLARLDRLESDRRVADASRAFDMQLAELVAMPERETDFDRLVREAQETARTPFGSESFDALDSVSSVSNPAGLAAYYKWPDE